MTAFTINGRIMGCARRQLSRGRHPVVPQRYDPSRHARSAENTDWATKHAAD